MPRTRLLPSPHCPCSISEETEVTPPRDNTTNYYYYYYYYY